MFKFVDNLYECREDMYKLKEEITEHNSKTVQNGCHFEKKNVRFCFGPRIKKRTNSKSEFEKHF